MDARGNTPRVWTEEADLADLARSSGPFLTVYMATPGDIENAALLNEAKWRAMREELEANGATELALKGMDEIIHDAHLEGSSTYAIADSDGLRHVSYWSGSPVREIGRWSDLPVLTPLLALRQRMIPHVRVTVDRVGAQIAAYEHQGNSLHRAFDASDDDRPVHKAQAGGWSQRRYEQRVENTWEMHAKDVAEQVSQLVTETRARAIFVAGDVRASQLLQSHLPEQLQPLVFPVDGSLAQDGSPLIDTDAIDRQLKAMVKQDASALVEKLQEEQGQGDRAAVSLEAVTGALVMSQAEVLLVADELDDNRTIYFGPEPGHIAVRRDDLEALGVDDPREGRLVDVLARAALGTGAGVWVLEDGVDLSDGVAAILRWA